MPNGDEEKPEEVPETSPSSAKQWIFDQFKEQPLQFMLVAAFIMITIAIVAVLAFSVLADRRPWEYQVAVRTLLAMAGALLVTIFLSRSRTAFSSTLGIVLIGALIVSTEDLLRFSLLFTGSDRSFEEFFIREAPRSSSLESQTESGKDTVDIAVFIADRLSARALLSTGEAVQEDAARIITDLLRLERNNRIMIQLEQRAADRLFFSIVDGNFEEWNFRFGNQDRFKTDLVFLRNLGLISYVYGEARATLQLTELGSELSDFVRRPSTASQVTDRQPRSVPVSIGTNASVNVESQGSWFFFEVDMPGVYEINVSSLILDPVAQIHTDIDSAPFLRDDDGGVGVNSRIVSSLGDDRYFLYVSDFSNRSGIVTIDISNYVEPPTVRLNLGAEQIGNVGLDGARFEIDITNAGTYDIVVQSDRISPVVELYSSSDFRPNQLIRDAIPEDDDFSTTRLQATLDAQQYGLRIYDDFGDVGEVSVTVREVLP